MNPTIALECTHCGRVFVPEDGRHVCPDHEGVGGILDVQYDLSGASDAIRAGVDDPIGDLWKYAPLLPTDGNAIELGAGGTPLLDAPTLSAELGVETRVKDETANPTGSNKDRGSAVVTTRARGRDHDVVACASTGNAAASLAGYAARAGLDCRIFVPADLPEAKAVQPRLYGATVLSVDGSYADAYDLCRRVSAERGWYNRNAAMNPYAVEGKRTLGFEIAEQAPDADWVVMPMGNGCSLAGAWKGLREFDALDLVEGRPRMLGVQAAGATAIHDRFVAERDGQRVADGATAGAATDGAGDTTADSIDVSVPHNAGKACRAMAESGGDAVVVDDAAISAAQRLLGESEGVFAEPASAAAVAGVRRARENGTIGADETVVVVATGTGLKDTASAREAVDGTVPVDADPESVPEEF